MFRVLVCAKRHYAEVIAVRRIIALATKGVPVEGCETTPLDLKDDTQRRVALQASFSDMTPLFLYSRNIYFYNLIACSRPIT